MSSLLWLLLWSLVEAVVLILIAMYLIPMILFMWARSIAAGWKSGSIRPQSPAFPFQSKKDLN